MAALTGALRPMHWLLPWGHAMVLAMVLISVFVAGWWASRFTAVRRWWGWVRARLTLWVWWGGMRVTSHVWDEAAHARACDRHLRLQWRLRWPDENSRQWSRTATGPGWRDALIAAGSTAGQDFKLLDELLCRGYQPPSALDRTRACLSLRLVARWVKAVWT